MYAIIKKQAKLPPRIDYCSKDELQALWDDIVWKLNDFDRLLQLDDLTLDEENCILRKMEALEQELEDIDYEWSRFPVPCDPSYSLEDGFEY